MVLQGFSRVHNPGQGSQSNDVLIPTAMQCLLLLELGGGLNDLFIRCRLRRRCRRRLLALAQLIKRVINPRL